MIKTVTPYLKKLATIEDVATGEFYVRFRIRTQDGQKREIELPRADLAEPTTLAKKLFALGAVLPAKDQRAAYLSALADAPCSRNLKRVGRSGWQNQYRSFVWQSKVLGLDKGELIGPPASTDENERGRFRTSGTYESWKSIVGVLSKSSSYAMLAVASAFAAPLLLVSGEDSFAICLSARTRSGKTAITQMGASVVGLGQKSNLLTWHNTESGLEEQLPRFNDCLSVIDDFESMKGSDVHKYERVRNAAYGVAAGAEKQRHSSFATRTRLWRTIVITSMEKPIHVLAAKTKQARQPGETVRLIDIPVLSKDRDHIFDLAEDGGTQITRKWKTKAFGSIINACRDNHGATFQRYVSTLCKDANLTKRRTDSYRSRFVLKVSRSEDGDMADDLARKFGLIYAGGAIAIRQKLVPWTRSELFHALAKCYCAARDLLPDEGVETRKGLFLLQEQLAKLKPKKAISSFDTEIGYRIKRNGTVQYVLKTKDFNSIFDSPYQRALVEASLTKSKRLTMTNPKNAHGKKAAKRQPLWPDRKRRRSIAILSADKP
jgi:putative DNA primase/helicase